MISAALLLTALAGAYAIRVAAARRFVRDRGGTFTTVFLWGWGRVRFFGVPAFVWFYGWFLGFGVLAIVVRLSK